MTKDRYGEAIGIWSLKIGDADLELKPKLGDNRKFMRLMMDNSKDKGTLMDKFFEFMVSLIHRDYPEDPIEKINEYVEFNINSLFEEIMIKFRWTTRDAMEAARKESLNDLKKLTGAN